MIKIKVAFATLGCKVNQDETAGIKLLFEQADFEIVPFKEMADVYIVNTCTVTHLGSRKSRQLLRQARRRNLQALVVAAGCYPQAAPEELEDIKEVDLIVGNSHKNKLVELVEKALLGQAPRTVVQTPNDFEELPVSIMTSRHRATMKIQEGCQRYCTYCIVPKARGRLRSMPVENIVTKGRELVKMGFREIVLTGINLTSYGRETGGELDLAMAVSALAREIGPARIRISSVEPTDFTSELIQVFHDHDNICRDFHIPLQSGSDTVLQRMGRKYSARDYLHLVRKLKAEFNNPSFSTDVIVGFPGETETEFAATRALIEEVGFCRLHVFRYSPRPGTPAVNFEDQVNPRIASQRSEILIDLGRTMAEQFADKIVGMREQLLVEQPSSIVTGNSVGYGERYIRIHCQTDKEPGSLIAVEIIERRGEDLLARQV